MRIVPHTDHGAGIEHALLALTDELRLLLKRDETFWMPEASAAVVLPALDALAREVAAVAVAPERAAPALACLQEVRRHVDQLYVPRDASGRSTDREFHAVRARALLALQEFRERLSHYFDALFGRPGAG